MNERSVRNAAKKRDPARRVKMPTKVTVERKRAHPPALIAPPAQLDALIRLVNLLPKSLRCQRPVSKPSPQLEHGKTHIIEFWSLKNDEDTVGRTWYFFVLTDALPI